MGQQIRVQHHLQIENRLIGCSHRRRPKTDFFHKFVDLQRKPCTSNQNKIIRVDFFWVIHATNLFEMKSEMMDADFDGFYMKWLSMMIECESRSQRYHFYYWPSSHFVRERSRHRLSLQFMGYTQIGGQRLKLKIDIHHPFTDLRKKSAYVYGICSIPYLPTLSQDQNQRHYRQFGINDCDLYRSSKDWLLRWLNQ